MPRHLTRKTRRWIERTEHLRRLRRLLKAYPVVGLFGARQVGKTTLAQQLAAQWQGKVSWFDLEDPRDLARLQDPMLTLEPLRGLVIIDELHRWPELFPVLRVLADRRPNRTRFLILGSVSLHLARRAAETLAGRMAHYTLGGLDLSEVDTAQLEQLWIRGGFPRSFLARSETASYDWRQNFIRTFLERDIPALGLRLSPETLRRFWQMLAHYHAQLWNASEFGRSFGVADTTVRSYLEVLAGAYVVRLLRPWHENIKKRQVKAPKVYIADSGLVHALLGLVNKRDIETHPKLGASWEGFIVEQIVSGLGLEPEAFYFWRTHAGAELDLLVVRGRRRWGFEIKRTSSPVLTPAMRSARKDLGLKQLFVIHAGKETFPLARDIRAVAWCDLLSELRALRRAIHRSA